MTTIELMNKINTVLLENGFETRIEQSIPQFQLGSASKDGKVYDTPVEGYSFTKRNGFEIHFRVVDRHNGTAENKSVDVIIRSWKNGLGYTFAKERIKVDYSEKQFDNRMKKIIDTYNML